MLCSFVLLVSLINVVLSFPGPNKLPRSEKVTVEDIKEHIGKGPEECSDFLNPSSKCQEAMKNSMSTNKDGFVGIAGGNLKYAWYSGCEDVHREALTQAAYDAYVLSSGAIEDVSEEKMVPIWKLWMGKDYANFKGRIIGNLGRIGLFKEQKKYDIYIACNDPRKRCGQQKDEKPVGGYAWTYRTIFGYEYSYINFCPVFYRLQSLGDKVKAVGDNKEKGDGTWAGLAPWQKNMGLFFLHEMMHLNITSGDEPHIKDELVTKHDGGGYAYGPRLVAQLARRPDGGAVRASTNADSYAWFANSIHFYKLFGSYPLPKTTTLAITSEELVHLEDEVTYTPPVIHVGHFQAEDHVPDDAFNRAFEDAMRGFGLDDGTNGGKPDATNATPSTELSPSTCDDKGDVILEGHAAELIDKFCEDIEIFNNSVIVPPIMSEVKKSNNRQTEIFGAVQEGPLYNSDQKLWMGVAFAQEHCIGQFVIAKGDYDKDSANCKSHLQKITTDCGLRGGTVKDVCEIWFVHMSKENPTTDWWKDKGEVKCGDTCPSEKCKETFGNSPSADSCLCWYTGYPDATQQFARPRSGQCDADKVNRAIEFKNIKAQ